MAFSFTQSVKELFKNKDVSPAILSKPIEQTLKPKAGYAVQGYEGAALYSRDRSYIWTVPSDEIINPSTSTRGVLSSLARHLATNVSVMEKLLNVTESYAIGNGLIANAATANSDFNIAATKEFDKWADSQFASSSNNLNFYEATKLIARELMLCGEAFLVLIKTAKGTPQFMPVSSENVRHSGEANDTSVEGVWCDDYGKPTAYNIFVGSKCLKIDAKDVVHFLRYKHFGQRRGVSAFSAAINACRDLDDVMTLLKKTVKAHSALSVQVNKKSGDATDGLLGDVAPLASANPLDPRIKAGLEAVYGGAVVTMGDGEDIKLITSANPSTNVMQFIENLKRQICEAVGIPYEFALNSSALNGTAMRFIIADASNFFASIQNTIIDAGLNRIYGWVINALINQGKLQLPQEEGFAYWNVSWTKPVSLTVDLQRASNTEIALIQNSLLNYESYYSSRAKDYKQELRQKASEEAYINELAAEFNIDVNRMRSLSAGTAAIPAVETLKEAA